MTPTTNNRNKKKLRRSVWMPILLLIYLAVMTIWFAPRLIAEGETVRLIVVVLSELAIIYALRVFLVKKERQDKEKGKGNAL